MVLQVWNVVSSLKPNEKPRPERTVSNVFEQAKNLQNQVQDLGIRSCDLGLKTHDIDSQKMCKTPNF